MCWQPRECPFEYLFTAMICFLRVSSISLLEAAVCGYEKTQLAATENSLSFQVLRYYSDFVFDEI